MKLCTCTPCRVLTAAYSRRSTEVYSKTVVSSTGRGPQRDTLNVSPSPSTTSTVPTLKPSAIPGLRYSTLIHCSMNCCEIIPLRPQWSQIIGYNDIKLHQSEKFKDDFKTLIDTVLESGRQSVISGPLPP